MRFAFPGARGRGGPLTVLGAVMCVFLSACGDSTKAPDAALVRVEGERLTVPDTRRALGYSVIELVRAELERLEQKHPKPGLPTPGEAKSENGTKAAETTGPPAGEAPVKTARAASFRDAQEVAAALQGQDLFRAADAIQWAVLHRMVEVLPLLRAELERERGLGPLAARAIGALGEKHHAPALLKHLADPDFQMRYAVILALSWLEAEKAVPYLIERLQHDKSFILRGLAADALGRLGDPRAVVPLKKAMNDSEELREVRLYAAVGLARLKDPAGLALLKQALNDPDLTQQMLALAGISALGSDEAAEIVLSRLGSPVPEIWTAVLLQLLRLPPAKVVETLFVGLESPSVALRLRAAVGLATYGYDDGEAYLLWGLSARDENARLLCAQALGLLGKRKYVVPLTKLLHDDSLSVRETAALALVRLGDELAGAALSEAADRAASGYERALLLAALAALRERAHPEAPRVRDLPKSSARQEAYERALLESRAAIIVKYTLVAVAQQGQGGAAVRGAVLRSPQGRDRLYLAGEEVFGGFVLEEVTEGQDSQGREYARCTLFCSPETRAVFYRNNRLGDQVVMPALIRTGSAPQGGNDR